MSWGKDAMNGINHVQRLYSMEGATHLYSSDPAMLTPADLYTVKHEPAHLAALENCNIYLIVRRPRILLQPERFTLNGRRVAGNFLVHRAHGPVTVPFEYDIPQSCIPANVPIVDVAIAANGVAMVAITPHGQQMVAVSVVIASSTHALTDADTAMEVLYVGQGIGRTRARTALDRLQCHSTLQRILADTLTNFYEREVLLLLYRFEHGRTIVSNGGDFNVSFHADDEADSAHFKRLQNVRLKRHQVVSLAEAGLINYFKPYYNSLLKTTSFSAKNKLKVLKQLLSKGPTGLIVELSTVNLRSRIGTSYAVPVDLAKRYAPDVLDGRNIPDLETRELWHEELRRVAHTHFAKFALTTAQERESFMHGTVFLKDSEGDKFEVC